MSAGCHYNAVNPLILRYSTGDQQRRYAGLLFTFYFIPVLVLASKLRLPRGIFMRTLYGAERAALRDRVACGWVAGPGRGRSYSR